MKLRHRRKRVRNIKNTTIIDPLCFHQSVTQSISSLLTVACLITALTLLFVSSQLHPKMAICHAILSLPAKQSVHFIGQVLHKCIICLNTSSQFQKGKGYRTTGLTLVLSSQVDSLHTALEYLILWATINTRILWEAQTYTTPVKGNCKLHVLTENLRSSLSLKILHKTCLLSYVLLWCLPSLSQKLTVS